MIMQSEELWPDYLVRARWFQAKGLPISDISLQPLPWYTQTADIWIRSELARVTVDETSQTYHIVAGYLPSGQAEPVALVGQAELEGRGQVDVVDVPYSNQAMACLLQTLTQEQSATNWLTRPPEPTLPTKVFTGEQTNTSVQIGEVALLKIFRKLQPGPNLESETLAALSGHDMTPRLLGTWSTDDQTYELGNFCQWITDTEDGWDYCVRACQSGQSITDEMLSLGQTLRQLHTGLADVFGTATITTTEISQRMLTRLTEASADLPDLSDLDGLQEILDLPKTTIEVQRLHGDFHLGQTLTSPTGWKIVDFEGEPLTSPDERSAFNAVWKDVAGLLRSLDYVRQSHHDPDGASARKWYQSARQAFLDGYASGSPLPLTLITAYEIDKAIYELIYETRNRPTWTGIPRRAINEAIKSRPAI